MDYLQAVQYYVTDRYPRESSFGSWRSEASLAAVQLLRVRINAGDEVGVSRVVNFLLNDVRPTLVEDPEVHNLVQIPRTGFVFGEARLYGLLLDLQSALEIPAEFVELHARRVWSAPSPLPLVGVVDRTTHDTRGWLSYFIKERQLWINLAPVDKAHVLDFLNVFYTRPPELNLRDPPLPHGPTFANSMGVNTYLNANQLPLRRDHTGVPMLYRLTNVAMNREYLGKSRILCAALSAMLRSGFVPVAKCGDDHVITGIPEDNVLTAHNSWGDLATTRNRVNNALREVPGDVYCWRGDNRPIDKVVQAGGLWCKAASEGYARDNNMRKPWHPFNDATCRNYMYYRCGQNDNCLYTAVSVTPAASIGGAGIGQFQFNNPHLNPDALAAFKINVTFPQLEEIPVGDRTRVSIRRQQNGVGVPDFRFYVDEVRLYLCKLPIGTRYVDTRWLQDGNGFPEIAVRGIPHNQIMATLVFIRVHHHDDNASGFTAIPVTDMSTNRFPANNIVTALYNAANIQFEAAWGPNGVNPPTLDWNSDGYVITRVGNMAVGGDGRIAQYARF